MGVDSFLLTIPNGVEEWRLVNRPMLSGQEVTDGVLEVDKLSFRSRLASVTATVWLGPKAAMVSASARSRSVSTAETMPSR